MNRIINLLIVCIGIIFLPGCNSGSVGNGNSTIQSQKLSLQAIPNGTRFVDVKFFDFGNGNKKFIAVGDDGIIAYSSNGTTWQYKRLMTLTNLNLSLISVAPTTDNRIGVYGVPDANNQRQLRSWVFDKDLNLVTQASSSLLATKIVKELPLKDEDGRNANLVLLANGNVDYITSDLEVIPVFEEHIATDIAFNSHTNEAIIGDTAGRIWASKTPDLDGSFLPKYLPGWALHPTIASGNVLFVIDYDNHQIKLAPFDVTSQPFTPLSSVTPSNADQSAAITYASDISTGEGDEAIVTVSSSASGDGQILGIVTGSFLGRQPLIYHPIERNGRTLATRNCAAYGKIDSRAVYILLGNDNNALISHDGINWSVIGL